MDYITFTSYSSNNCSLKKINKMAKSKDTKKEVKKEPLKTPKEKKAEKKLKKPNYD